MEKRWRFYEADKNCIEEIRETTSVSPIVAQLLYNRGISDATAARHFLQDTMADLYDPFVMKDMEKAVKRISRALDDGEKIVIYGDYDVDGITSTSLVYSVLRDLGGQPEFYIPQRQSEGYGLNTEAVASLQQQGVQVLITVDCGISSHAIIEQFRDAMDIIVTDHHEPPQDIPRALAVLNPKQADCPYPFKDLAGAGVAYTLCRALWQYRCHESLSGYTELCALGTIADLVPLRGENRILVRDGLQRMKERRNIGLSALLDSSGLTQAAITAGRIAFTAAPRLNAAGRISHARRGVQLLLGEDPVQARELADELTELNAQRQSIEKDIADQAVAQIETAGQEKDGVLIAYGTDWHAGVIGIAASRLVEKFYRPSLVISVHDGIGKGSCRSISGFNMYEALQAADDLLIQYGGHPMAAGFSIEAANIEAFRKRLLAYAADHMKPEDYIPLIKIDKQLAASDINLRLIEELSCLEPYGMGNSRPVFALQDARLLECRPIGRNKQHLRLSVAAGRERLAAVGWSMAERSEELLEGDKTDLAFQLESNEYNGTVSAQLVLQDIHNHEAPVQLNRAVMIDMYMALKTCLPEWGLPVWQAQQRLIAAERNRYSGHTACAAIRVFKEIGVLAVRETDEGPVYYFPALHGKMQLETSPTYRKYYQAEGGI